MICVLLYIASHETGGLSATLDALPRDLDATVLAFGADVADDLLPSIRRASRLPIRTGPEPLKPEAGRIYVAESDWSMHVADGRIHFARASGSATTLRLQRLIDTAVATFAPWIVSVVVGSLDATAAAIESAVTRVGGRSLCTGILHDVTTAPEGDPAATGRRLVSMVEEMRNRLPRHASCYLYRSGTHRHS